MHSTARLALIFKRPSPKSCKSRDVSVNVHTIFGFVFINYRFNSLCIYQLSHGLTICTARYRAVAKLHKGCSGTTIAQQNKGEGGCLLSGQVLQQARAVHLTVASCFAPCRLCYGKLKAGVYTAHGSRRGAPERGGTPAGEWRNILLQPATGYVTAPTTSQGERTLGQ